MKTNYIIIGLIVVILFFVYTKKQEEQKTIEECKAVKTKYENTYKWLMSIYKKQKAHAPNMKHEWVRNIYAKALKYKVSFETQARRELRYLIEKEYGPDACPGVMQ